MPVHQPLSSRFIYERKKNSEAGNFSFNILEIELLSLPVAILRTYHKASLLDPTQFFFHPARESKKLGGEGLGRKLVKVSRRKSIHQERRRAAEQAHAKSAGRVQERSEIG